MNPRRFLSIVLLLAFLLPGLTVAVAQDAQPAKGASQSAGLTREEAIESGLLEIATTPVDENEPNNTPAQADLFYPAYGEHISGLIGSVGDKDYFEIGYEVTSGDTIAFSVAAKRFRSNLDSVLNLYDQNGNWLAGNDDYTSLDSYFEYTIPASLGGQYLYLLLTDFMDQHGGADHWYDLYIWVKDSPSLQGCKEPNNTKGQAKAIAYTDTLECPTISQDGDADWYKFEGKKGDVAQVTVMTTEIHGTVESKVTLYNGTKILAQCGEGDWGPNDTNCYLEATLPKTGTYHILVTDAHNKGGADKRYWLELWFADPFESNNSIANAWPIAYGQTMRAHTSPGDPDWYKFYGHAGELVSFMGSPGVPGKVGFWLVDSDQTTGLADNYEFADESRLNAMSYELPHDGWYYVNAYKVMGWVDYYPSNMAYEFTVGPMELMGMQANGKIGNLQFDRGDILAYFPNTDSYRMYFDGSSVGANGNLADFEVLFGTGDYGTEQTHSRLLLTYIGTTKLPGLGAVTAQDIVAFVPNYFPGYSEFTMFLDGSDIGLTTGNETIDALAWSYNYDWYNALIFSTTGKATITSRTGNLTAEDEDLVVCYLHQTGWDTDASCYLLVDGSLAGLPATADIASVSITEPGPFRDVLYMTFTAPVVIEGVKYQPNDIAVCEWMPDFDCDWLPRYWIGNDNGLKGKKVDGQDLLRQ